MNATNLNQLIDESSRKCGSDYKLAQELGTSRQSVSDWRHGRKTCPAGDVALMAQIAGLEPEAWLARAVCDQYDGAKRERLQKALKKSLAVIGGGITVSGCTVVDYFTRCIKSSGQYRFATWGKPHNSGDIFTLIYANR
jgi:hypothetical protein